MRTLCVDCKESYKPDQLELDHLIDVYGREDFAALGIDLNNVELKRAVGCESCGDSGYRGRIGVHELLQGTHAMQSLIYKKSELVDIRAQALKDGMRTLKQDGIMKIFEGHSDYTQLLRIVAE